MIKKNTKVYVETPGPPIIPIDSVGLFMVWIVLIIVNSTNAKNITANVRHNFFSILLIKIPPSAKLYHKPTNKTRVQMFCTLEYYET